VGEALETFGVPYLVVERDPDIVRGLRARGVPCVFGDGAQPTLVEVAGAHRARLAVVAIPEGRAAELALVHLRAASGRLPILARAHDAQVAERMEQQGATRVIRPEVEGAAALIRAALGELALPPERVLAYLDRFRQAMELPDQQILGEADRLPQVRDVTIGAGEIADQSLREARVRERFGVTVLTLVRGEGADVVLNPPPETVLRPGDRARVFGLPDQIRAFADSARQGDDRVR
jgi:CPA2 family monovalent cation:H+ antiporter-2